MPVAAVRLWHQSMTELDGLGVYRERLAAHAASLLGDAVTVDLHGVAPGSYAGAAPTDVLNDPAIYGRVARQSLDAAVEAERLGYDAFVIGSYSEPLLAETRDAVGIPVVSVSESTMLVSFSLGRRPAFISNAPSVADLVAASVARHGFGGRVFGVHSVEPALTEVQLVEREPGFVVDAFVRRASELVAAGADVIVPAEAVMCEVLYERGLAEIDAVPVLDSVGTTWRYALMLASL